MIKTREFEAFGRQYRTTQHPAVKAIEVMSSQETDPVAVLSSTMVMDRGSWKPLDSPSAVNELVFDDLGQIAPRLVLNGLISVISDLNFGFLRTWKSAKIPPRFTSGAQSIESKNMDPTIGTLTTEGQATLRELEEYYSLEDAYKMFDALVVKGINSALGQEAAAENAKR